MKKAGLLALLSLFVLGMIGCSGSDGGSDPDKDKEALKRFDTAGVDNGGAPKTPPSDGEAKSEGL